MNRWGRLVNRKRLVRQLRAELEYHLERQVADNLRAGMSEEEARPFREGTRFGVKSYVPFLQFRDEFMSLTQSGRNLLVRTSIPPMSVVQAVKHSVFGRTRDQPVRDVVTMEQQIGASIGKRRGMLFLLSIFAGVALLLASIGIYGVISYSMSRRVQEIGIRMALGAQAVQGVRLVVRQAMGMVLTGVVAGAVVSLALAHLMTKLLYGVSPTDPVTFALVVVTLCSVAFAAIYIPARRAARMDPVLALRYE